MEVKKRAPNVIRVTGPSVRIADRTIQNKKGYLKKGLTASVIGSEEEEEENKSSSSFEKNRITRKKRKERGILKQRVASGITRRGSNSDLKKIRQENNDGKGNVYQAFKLKSVFQFSITGKAEKQSQKEGGNLFAANQKSIGKKVAKKTGKVASSVLTGATTATTGVTTGGTTVVVVTAVKAVVGTIKKTKEVLKKAVTKDEENKNEKSSGGMMAMLFAGIAASLLPVLMVLSLLIPIALIGSVFQIQELNGANRIVLIARQEANDAEENIGGQKYKDWYRLDADWCAIFVSWCGDQCGYLNSDIMPRTASVDVMKNWYEDKKLYHTKESGYEPKMGDIIFFGNGASHVGIVSEYNAEDGIVRTIEGNTGRSVTTPYHAGSRVKENWYPTTYKQIIGYATPEYPLEVIEIPEPYGTEYSYMGWQMITSKNSKQYKLREEAGMNFDEDGFGKINDRYVIACTTTFGQVGDYIDWELDNGTVIKTVIGDIKNQNDEGCNEWGHRNGLCVIEFVVDKGSWYGKGKYPTDFHSEWDGRTVRATKVGSFW